MDSQTGEVIDPVAHEVSSQHLLGEAPQAAEETTAEPPEAPQPEAVAEKRPDTPQPERRDPPAQSTKRSDAEERAAKAFSTMFYTRWDPLFPEDKDHEIAHREFRVASIKDLYGTVTAQQMAPLLDTLDLGKQGNLTLAQSKEALGLVYLIDWFSAGYTREGGVEAIARYIEQQTQTRMPDVAGQQQLQMPSELAENRAPPPSMDAEESETEQGEPTTAKPHWIENEQVRKRFWAWTTKMALNSNEVHEALEVEHIGNYDGSMLKAKDQIIAYVNSKAADPAT